MPLKFYFKIFMWQHIVTLTVDAQHHPQLLATYSMQNPLDFSHVNVMRLIAISK